MQDRDSQARVHRGRWQTVQSEAEEQRGQSGTFVLNITGPDCEPVAEGDCNENRIPDECDIASGYSDDANENGVPDECETP